jgi:hypothetical protein
LCGLVSRDYVFGVRSFADSLHACIFGAVVIAGGDNVPVECAADLFAIFEDGGLCAYLHAAIFDNFNAVYGCCFFKCHFDNPIKIKY